MLGEFFGLTATSAALLDISPLRFPTLVSTLNTKLDTQRLTKFRVEIDYLLDFLETKVKTEYSSPELKKKLRQAELVRAGAVDRLQRIYGFDISNVPPSDYEKIAKEIIANVEKEARETGVDITVTNRFESPDSGEMVSLEPLDLQILKTFKKEYVSTLTRYHKSCVTGSFEETMVFGKRLSDIATKAPTYLLYLVTEFFDRPNVDIRVLTKLCEEWIQIITTHMADTAPDDQSTATQMLDYFESIARFDNFMLTAEGKNKSVHGVEDLTPESKELVEKYYQDTSFLDYMRELIHSNSLSKSLVEYLVDLHFEAFRLDNDIRFVKSRLLLDEDVTLDQLDASYARLSSIGFYFLHRNNATMLVESLKKISFTQSKRTLFKNEEVRGYTFESVLADIRYLCKSLHPMGTKLGEI